MNLITGKKRHHAEFRLTIVPFLDHYKTFLSGDNVSDKYLYIIPAINYRFQPLSGRFFFKAGVNPLIVLDPPSYNFWKMEGQLLGYGNIGIGYSF